MCKQDVDLWEDDEEEEEEPLTLEEYLQRATRTLMTIAKPATRKRILACLESCTLGQGTLYRVETKAVCLLGTAIPKSRKRDYNDIGSIDYQDWNRWFTEDHQDVNQQDIYEAWDEYVKAYDVDDARQVALAAAKDI